MPNRWSRVAFFSLLTFACWQQLAVAQVEPADLDSARIQDRVGKYLASERGQLRVRLLSPLIATPRVADLVYKKDAANQPESLVWTVRAARSLTAQEARDVEQETKNVLEQAFADSLGEGKPFLTDANSKKVLAATRVVVEPRRQDTSPQTSPQTISTPQLYMGWAQVCYPCGCCCYCYYVPVWYYVYAPVQVSASSTARVDVPARPSSTAAPVAPVAFNPTEKNFARALDSFRRGERGAALVWLTAASEVAADDARVWAFKALAERSLGDVKAAQLSAQRAAALQLLGRGPDADAMARALASVDDSERAFLRSVDDGKMTKSNAQSIVSKLFETHSVPAAVSSSVGVTRK